MRAQPPAESGRTAPAAPPALAHTRARPGHWLGTAVALAAVVTGAVLLGPGEDRAPAADRVPAADAPDPAAARYPLDCGAAGVEVVQRAAADLDADGRPETVAVVRCRTGAGTPPSGVYVLAPSRGAGGSPRVVATLLDPGQRMSVTDFSAAGSTISATLLGYSAPGVPRCCPDLRRGVEWRWREGKFVLTPLPTANSV
ncbi:hypothetical protein ACFP1Z_00760 [Streptomyces gamaensis]|uniref:Secreted protein n=1 Tax=Streptomyces gamaensis TaxID=1763542 RepID=A0ABW0YQ61_9ACTN